MPVTVFVGTSVDGFRRAPRVSECGGKFRKTLDGLLRCIEARQKPPIIVPLVGSDSSEQLARSPAPRRGYGRSE